MDLMVLEMKEGEKRKSERDDGVASGALKKKKRGKEEEEFKAEQPVGAVAASEEVADEEVEEFFTILRRIHAAVKYFAKGDGGNASGCGRKSIQATGRLCSDEKKREDDENRGFDLNSLPNEDDN